MSLKIKVYHECAKPSMLVSEKEVEWTTGRFWWTKKRSRVDKVYQETEGYFVCDDCKSEYRYNPGRAVWTGDNNKGYWSAEKRTFTWKKVEV